MVYGWAAWASPSSSGATSTRTICPGAGFSPSIGSQLAFRSRRSLSCSSTAAGVTGATRRLSENPPVCFSDDRRPHLDVKFELDGAVRLELEVVDVRFGDRLEVLGGPGCFPALPDQLLEHRLADCVAEPLPDHRLRGLPGPETGQPGALPIEPDGLGLGLADPVRRHRHLE